MERVTVTPERPEGAHAPVPPPQRLRRDSDRALLGGVCSGLANRIGIDPLVVRLAFVAAAVAGGWGIVLYLLLWAFVPAEEGQSGPAARRLQVGRRGWQLAIGIGFVVLAVMLLARDSGIWFSDALVWPVVLAAGGAALIWRQSQSHGASPRQSSTWQSGPEAAASEQQATAPPLIASVRLAAAEARRVMEPSSGPSGRATLGVALIIA